MKEYTNEEIKQFIKENPIYLTGNYNLGAEKFNCSYERFRHISRTIRKENVNSTTVPTFTPSTPTNKIEFTGTPGAKFNPTALKEFVKDTMSDFEVTRNIIGGVKKLAIISDLHGIFLCKKTFNCFLEIVKNNHFDEININGDCIDLPMLSRHSHKLINRGPMVDYSEIKEVEFVKTEILQKLRDVTKANIVYRLGNHDERVTNPLNLSQQQLARLAILYNHYGTVKLEQMLDLENIGIEYDPTAVRSYYNIFDTLHGLSLAKNAPEQNIMMRMNSGSSGHSHRLQAKYFTKADRDYVWVESGCMRLKHGVEYMPTAVTADWQAGFATINFDLEGTKPRFFAESHAIIHGNASYHGKIYRG